MPNIIFNNGYRTGHRSSAVRNYKRPSAVLGKEVSEALQPPDSPKKVKLNISSECVMPKERQLVIIVDRDMVLYDVETVLTVHKSFVFRLLIFKQHG